ncbi:DnaJ domain-containing protein [Pedosphaera parvula]|uniref:Heat shock protein DnaJ domain protein n=1 Tax=Pedosphaera parvula (strain Ellin514) TaxID=320771 RepID=B9XDA4_PEDPL|nr:DnaJ domain-containing protein [Pedosphaera parvula]EEF62050.1 heat shock protein DnaJ domain protein [Pedosphaera parvula Ellin514]
MDEIARCYQLLGLEAGASHEEVKQAYRDLVKVWHPDRFSHDPRLQIVAQEKLKEINGVYQILESSFFEASITPALAEEIPTNPDNQPTEQSGPTADGDRPKSKFNKSALIIVALTVLVLISGVTPFIWKFYRAGKNLSSQPSTASSSPEVPVELKDVELILKDGSAIYTGKWTEVSPGKNKKGRQFHYAGTVDGLPTATATFVPSMPKTGNYDVYVWYTAGGNRSSSAAFEVVHNGVTNNATVNELINGGRWEKILAEARFRQGTNGFVRLNNNTDETNRIVVIHAVRFVASDTQ